jgi:hypothetical protein
MLPLPIDLRLPHVTEDLDSCLATPPLSSGSLPSRQGPIDHYQISGMEVTVPKIPFAKYGAKKTISKRRVGCLASFLGASVSL